MNSNYYKALSAITLVLSLIACSDSTSSSSPDSSSNSSSAAVSNQIPTSSTTQNSSSSEVGFGTISIKEISKYTVTLSILFTKGADLKISTDSTFTDEKAGYGSGYYSASTTPVEYSFTNLKAGTKYYLRFEDSFAKEPSKITSFTTSPPEAPIISLKAYENLDILIANQDDIGTLELSEDSIFSKPFSPDTFAIRNHLFPQKGEQRIQAYLGQTLWVRSTGSTGLHSNIIKLQAPPAMQWQSNALDTLAYKVSTSIDPSETRTITLDSSDVFDQLIITIPNFKENVELASTDDWSVAHKKGLITLEKSTSKFMTLRNQVKDGWLDLYIPFYSVQEKLDEFDNSSPERYSSSDIRIRVKL